MLVVLCLIFMRKDRKRWTHPNWLSFCRICWLNQLGRGISTPQQMLRLQQWLTMKLQENSAVDNLVNETHFPCDTATPIGNSFFGSFCVPSSDFLQMLRVSLSKKNLTLAQMWATRLAFFNTLGGLDGTKPGPVKIVWTSIPVTGCHEAF